MMRNYKLDVPASEQVRFLVSKLAEVETALHTATGGGIDAIISPEGHTILLRETQQALRATNERLSHMIAHSPAVIYSLQVIGNKRVPLVVSENITRMLGYWAHDTLHTDWWAEHIHPEDREGAVAISNDVLKTGSFRMEYRLRHLDGSYHWVEDHARAISDADGRVFEITGVWTDVTERHAAEERLRVSEAGLAAAQRLAQLGSWDIDLSHIADVRACPMRWSDELCRIFGYDPGYPGASSERWLERVHPEDRDRLVQALSALIHDGESYELVYRIIRLGGNERVVNDRAEVVETNAVRRIMGTVQDITRRSKAEEGRRQSEERFTRMFRSSPAAMAFSDAEGRVVDVNDRFLSIFGYHRDEVIGRASHELNFWANPLDREEVMRLAQVDGRICDVEREFRCKTDGILTCSVSMEVLRFGGRPMHLWMLADVTQRKKDEEALRMQSRVLESMSEGVNVADAAGTIIFSNPASDAMFGYERGTLVGRKVSLLNDLSNHESERLSADIRERVQRTGSWNGEIASIRKNGQSFVTLAHISAVEIFGQKCVVTVREDITQTKQLQAQLLRAQRMESLGRLAGGIAHDMNNILAPIIMAVPLLRSGLGAETNERLLGTVETSATRGAQLVKQLLFFGRGVEGQRITNRAKDLLREIEDIVSETFPKNIEISLRVAPDTATLLGDPTQLHQVFLNLCVNSRDAMPDGGTLSIEAKNATLTPEMAALSGPDAHAGNYVQFTVSDTGTGIPRENLDKIFDPFFTTKELGKGTGLGLASVIGIVKSHEGFLNLRSTVGAGTTFEVHLPAMRMPTEPTRAGAPTSPPRGSKQTILIVDDEPFIRGLASETLEQHGYVALTATNGAEAISLFSRHADKIALVITDIDMPVMDGARLIHTLRTHRPDLRVIVSTGLQSGLRIKEKTDLESIDSLVLLPKPYSIHELLRVVHAELKSCHT